MSFTEHLIGKRERISWVAETSYGSGGTMSSGDIVGYDAKLSPQWNQNWQEILSAGADNRNVQGYSKGPLSYPFTLTFNPVDWKFLKYATMSVANAGSDPYTHTFTLANTIQSFKLEWAKRHSTNHVITLTGCVVLKYELRYAKPTGAGEGRLVVVATCVAQAASPGSSVTSLSNITAEAIKWHHVKLTLNNTEEVRVNSGVLTIDCGIDPNDSRYCNATLARAIGEPIPKTFRVFGMNNITLTDKTYYDYFDGAATVSNSKLEFIRGANDNIVFTFAGLKTGSPGEAPTNFDQPSNIDFAFMTEGLTSLIATDSTATY